MLVQPISVSRKGPWPLISSLSFIWAEIKSWYFYGIFILNYQTQLCWPYQPYFAYFVYFLTSIHKYLWMSRQYGLVGMHPWHGNHFMLLENIIKCVRAFGVIVYSYWFDGLSRKTAMSCTAIFGLSCKSMLKVRFCYWKTRAFKYIRNVLLYKNKIRATQTLQTDMK